MCAVSSACLRKHRQRGWLDKSDRYIERLLIQAAAPAARLDWSQRRRRRGFQSCRRTSSTRRARYARHFPRFPLPVGAHAAVNHVGEPTKCQGWCSWCLNHRKSAPDTVIYRSDGSAFDENGASFQIFFL
jgi:hypothetical protein